MARDLLIIGASGLAREMAHLARLIDPDARRWPRIRYVAESADARGTALVHGPVDLCDDDLPHLAQAADAVMGIGYPRARQKVADRLVALGSLEFPNLVHPRIDLHEASITLGRGNVLTQGVVMTCDIAIGDFNLFNLNVTVGHDARIGHHNVVNPGCNISGRVALGDACLVGTGAQILEGCRVAGGARIGAGAVVTRDIAEPDSTWVGVPARRLGA